MTSSKDSIYEDGSPTSPGYPTDQSADSMFGTSNSGSTSSLAMGHSTIAGKTGNFKKHYSVSLEKFSILEHGIRFFKGHELMTL